MDTLGNAPMATLKENFDQIVQGKLSVSVLGLGMSGVQAALFLRRCEIPVTAYDDATRAEFLQRDTGAETISQLEQAGITLCFAPTKEDFCHKQPALAIISPGVPFNSWHVALLRDQNVFLTNDLELGLVLTQCPYVLITGSNGKTTTSCLLHHILQQHGMDAHLVGNVGHSLLAELFTYPLREDELAQWYVAEVSSFQIESAQGFCPSIGIFLNISPNHLDRHDSLEDYFEIKSSPFRAMRVRSTAILNRDDELLAELSDDLIAQVQTFGTSQLSSGNGARISFSSEKDEVYLFRGSDEFALDLTGTKLIGLHNRYNIAAAALAALEIGASLESIEKGIKSFVPIAHRFECIVREPVTVINDSKSTTVASSKAALSSALSAFPDTTIWLLVGGKDKGGDWSELARFTKFTPGVVVIPFGQASSLIEEAFSAVDLNTHPHATCKAAIEFAQSKAQPGDVILFTPGGSSFDEFRSYEERGEFFRSCF
ncbi:MAG: UDP-N-acetylmuramoyl-L-alanine--D-glutamate ligase [Bdellovibrionales bacterium]|nr:UDP-N-acetylmuramoyl-L-alanine--D-glutamate ligase [Bdellovibrionales bacterium]